MSSQPLDATDAPVAHKPYVPASTILPELSPLPILMGIVLGIIFGAASLYLALKIGLTVSASIPIAVMSISIFKWFSRVFKTRPATILENNIVQTTGSAGESIAFGVAVTMPALLILGQDMDVTRIVTVAVLGGLLGILMMIPLRRGLIVQEHGKLAYPEGTACAEVLVAGEKGGTNAKTVFTGFGVGFLYKLLSGEGGFTLFRNTPEKMLSWFKGGSISAEISPELLGVGYIIGPKIAGVMCAGGVLAYLVLIPAIKIFGDGLAEPLFPATSLIKDMGPHEVRNAYVLYIGAGAVAAGGIISLLRVIPTIVGAFAAGVKNLLAGQTAPVAKNRHEDDLPMWVVIGGSILLVVALLAVRSLQLSILTAPLILVFGFLFVTVSSRLTGTIGSSSNPISGMTVATLLLTCLLFLAFGRTSPMDRVAALSIAAVVCIASSNGGTTSQDLKTGFLVGGTPRYQQIGILFGAVTSALVIGFTLKLFNDSATIFHRVETDYAVAPGEFTGTQTLFGQEAERDGNEYNIVHFTGETAPRAEDGKYILEPGKYLADASGKVVYLVDPGINGRLTHRDPAPGMTTGTEVKKFDAPKARLMSLIIDGILTRKLPWGLVLLGVFIALTLELSGISSLPFAVGVYLPISASTPIWIGGLVRWAVEKKQPVLGMLGVIVAVLALGALPAALDGSTLSLLITIALGAAALAMFVAGYMWGTGKPAAPPKAEESDSSPGVLLSSGLIAGGAIAGMMLALLLGFAEKVSGAFNIPRLVRWWTAPPELAEQVSDLAKQSAAPSAPRLADHLAQLPGDLAASEGFLARAFTWFSTSNMVALVIFLLLALGVYLVGREVLLKPKPGEG